MAALDKYDVILAAGPQALSQPELLAALYGRLCCLAAAGQVDSAKAALRSAFDAGLDYERALAESERSAGGAAVRLEGSTQMRRLLSAFAAQLASQREQAMARRLREEAAAGARAEGAGGEEEAERERLRRAARLEELMGSAPARDAGGTTNLGGEKMTLDTSPGAIARRVAGLLALGVVLFPVVFYLGLRLAFPE